jgi:hypothetical protein
MKQHRSAWLLSILLPLVIWSTGCAAADPPRTPITSLAEARSLWQRAALRDYDFEYWTGGFDQSPLTRVSVRGGVVAGVQSLVPGSDARVVTEPDRLAKFRTIDGLFDRVARAQAGDEIEEHLGDATFDPKLGFPTHAKFINGREVWDFTVRELTAPWSRVNPLP